MNIEQFHTSLAHADPPAGLSPLLIALWWDGRGEWDRAHDLAQAHDESQHASQERSKEDRVKEDRSHADRSNANRNAAWVHAYLHRKEGDRQNAGYWYRMAARPMPDSSLEEEWRSIASEMLQSI